MISRSVDGKLAIGNGFHKLPDVLLTSPLGHVI